jgi:uncharacterized protein YndB with AHSA1/START domain
VIIDGDIVHEVFYPFPVERVWKALTDPAELAAWLMPNNFRAEVGHRFRMEAPIRGGGFECEVLEVNPPRRLAYIWLGGPLKHTVVSWTLTPQEGGTRLHLHHHGFREDDPAEIEFRGELDQGWESLKLTGLAALLEDPAIAAESVLRPDGFYEHPAIRY